MQNVKDTFYCALRDRLAAFNPARTVFVNGIERPALVVVENEMASLASEELNVFYLTWSGAKAIQSRGEPIPLLEIECEIHYGCEGDEALNGQDRGRALGAMDEELIAIAQPVATNLKDHTQSPALELGAKIFWTLPHLLDTKVEGHRLTRSATMRIHAFAEGNW